MDEVEPCNESTSLLQRNPTWQTSVETDKAPRGAAVTKRTIAESFICTIAFFSRGLCFYGVGPSLLDLREITSISVPQSAWIFVAQSSGLLVGCLPVKVILSRYKLELVVAIFLLTQALCTFFTAIFKDIIIMCLMFFGQGFSLAISGIGIVSKGLLLSSSNKRIFLQCIYFGMSIGSLMGPVIARPFLSQIAVFSIDHHLLLHTLGEDNSRLSSTTPSPRFSYSLEPRLNLSVNNVTISTTPSRVSMYYILQGLIALVPAISFFCLHLTTPYLETETKEDNSQSNSSYEKTCTVSFGGLLSMMFLLLVVYYGLVDTYNNLLTTYAVLGPLNMSKDEGVYLLSAFWGSICLGRLIGVWGAKKLSPYKLSLVDLALMAAAALGLVAYADKYAASLWGFTMMFGLAFSTSSGALVSWITGYFPGYSTITYITLSRCVGFIILPASATLIFDHFGPVSLMYSTAASALLLPILLIVIELILRRTTLNSHPTTHDMERAA